MAWQHQTCFLAGRACTFQHAQLGALQQKPLLGRHPDGAPTVQAPDQTYWAAVGGQTGHKKTVKSPSQVPEKNLDDVFTLYFECIWDVITTYCYVLTMYQ